MDVLKKIRAKRCFFIILESIGDLCEFFK